MRSERSKFLILVLNIMRVGEIINSLPSLDQIRGPWSHSVSRSLWAKMQHFMSFSVSQMVISYHYSIRESCLRKHYTTNQKTWHIPVKPRLYCLPCKLSSQIETAKNRCYNYASQMSIRSLVQIAQSQKQKTNKQTYPVQTS